MRRIILFSFVFLTLIFFPYCTQQNEEKRHKIENYSITQNNNFVYIESMTLKERADSLKSLYEKIQITKNISERNKYKRMFFILFPDNYNMLDSIYGFDQVDGPSFLYHDSYNHVSNVFYKLDNIINKDEFIKRIIDISVGARCECDAIAHFQYELQQMLPENKKMFCALLSDYSDDEIFNFWYFLYDGPHPENYKADYKELHPKIKKIDKNIAALMEKAFEQLLLSEDRCPGH